VRLDNRVGKWKVYRHQLARVLADAVTTDAWIGQALSVSAPPQFDAPVLQPPPHAPRVRFVVRPEALAQIELLGPDCAPAKANHRDRREE
jgi:hypothetical protein